MEAIRGESVVSRAGPLLSNGDTALDRFPAMRSVFEQISDDFGRYFAEASSTSVELSVKTIGAKKIDALQMEFSEYESAALCYMNRLETHVAIGVSHNLVLALVELMFGAGSVNSTINPERLLTKIDKRVASFVIECFTKAMKNAFRRFAETDFHVGSMEETPDLTSLGRKSNIALYCVFEFGTQGRGLKAIIVLPRAALEPFRAILSDTHQSELNAQTHRWAQRIQRHAGNTPVILNAIIEKPNLTLEEIAKLKVGALIELPIGPSGHLKLDCQGKLLFWCALGQKDGHYTVRISATADELNNSGANPSQ
jgi:flagellar motor switch protein FliM